MGSGLFALLGVKGSVGWCTSFIGYLVTNMLSFLRKRDVPGKESEDIPEREPSNELCSKRIEFPFVRTTGPVIIPNVVSGRPSGVGGLHARLNWYS
jgi:hypothetical protein